MGESLPKMELPDTRNIVGLEQGEGQASKGSEFNLANAMVIFASTIMQMLFAVRNAFPQQMLLTIYSLGCLQMKQFLSQHPRRVLMCRGLGLTLGSQVREKLKSSPWPVSWASALGMAARTCRLRGTRVNPHPPGQPCVLTEKGSEALGTSRPPS